MPSRGFATLTRNFWTESENYKTRLVIRKHGRCTPKPLGHSGRIITSPWGNEDTQQLIDILKKYQVKATFFVVGEWVDKYPESVKALHEAGHEIMNHSNTHAHYPQLTVDKIVSDLNTCNDKIEAVTGVRPTLVRLPYGDYDDNSINAVRSIGMEPIQWDVDVSQTSSSACGTRV